MRPFGLSYCFRGCAHLAYLTTSADGAHLIFFSSITCTQPMEPSSVSPIIRSLNPISFFYAYKEHGIPYTLISESGRIVRDGYPAKDALPQLWDAIHDRSVNCINSLSRRWDGGPINPVIPLHYAFRYPKYRHLIGAGLDELLASLAQFELQSYQMCLTAALLGDLELFNKIYELVGSDVVPCDRKRIRGVVCNDLFGPSAPPSLEESLSFLTGTQRRRNLLCISRILDD